MDFQFNLTVILFLLSVGSLFGLLVGYLWGNLERRNRAQLRNEQAQVERRVSEPMPVKRDTSSAVHCLDQIDALLKCLDEQEMNDEIKEMQRRGW